MYREVQETRTLCHCQSKKVWHFTRWGRNTFKLWWDLVCINWWCSKI